MNRESNNPPDPEILNEYDFSGGVRGKYAGRFPKGCNVVVLDLMPHSVSHPSLARSLRLDAILP
jgi:hypothetical protein